MFLAIGNSDNSYIHPSGASLGYRSGLFSLSGKKVYISIAAFFIIVLSSVALDSPADDLGPPSWRALSESAFEARSLSKSKSTKTARIDALGHMATIDAPVSYAKSKARAEPVAIGNRRGLVRRAQELIGTPYRWGGVSEVTGFDCSGLLVYLFRSEAGLELPRTTTLMIDAGFPSLSRDELRPGDAVFFDHIGRGRVSHVGLYIGDNQFIHAPRTGKAIRIDSLSNSYWNSRFTGARRFESNSQT